MKAAAKSKRHCITDNQFIRIMRYTSRKGITYDQMADAIGESRREVTNALHEHESVRDDLRKKIFTFCGMEV